MLARLSAWAKAIKAELLTLWFAAKHPRTPLAAKIVAAIVVAYAFSPIDLIPDFIPVLGYLDDLLIVPLGIWLAFRLMPEAVRAEARAQAEQWIAERRDRPRSYVAAALIIAVWIALALWLAYLFSPRAFALDNEIRVFTDEQVPYRESSLELHANTASRSAARSGNPSRPLQLMPEYSYGFRPNWEASLQLPFAEEAGAWRSNGFRLELLYVAPHDPISGFYWGWNGEIGRSAQNGERSFWAAELDPILGVRSGRWHLTANPGVKLALSGEDRTVALDPKAKAAYRVSGDNYLGMEYHGSLVFLVWDGKVGASDINLGIGRGTSPGTEPWVAKVIFEFPYK